MSYKQIYNECIANGMSHYEADDIATYFEGISKKQIHAMIEAVTKQVKDK